MPLNFISFPFYSTWEISLILNEKNAHRNHPSFFLVRRNFRETFTNAITSVSTNFYVLTKFYLFFMYAFEGTREAERESESEFDPNFHPARCGF